MKRKILYSWFNETGVPVFNKRIIQIVIQERLTINTYILFYILIKKYSYLINKFFWYQSYWIINNTLKTPI